MNRLHTMGIDNLFSECYGEELIKPDIEIYLKTCGTHNLDECAMIGADLYLDIEKVQDLGVNTILVNSKKLNFEGLYIVVVSNVEEISVSLIESINKSKSCK